MERVGEFGFGEPLQAAGVERLIFGIGPAVLQVLGAFRKLLPEQVEDCLCIYKKELKAWGSGAEEGFRMSTYGQAAVEAATNSGSSMAFLTDPARLFLIPKSGDSARSLQHRHNHRETRDWESRARWQCEADGATRGVGVARARGRTHRRRRLAGGRVVPRGREMPAA